MSSVWLADEREAAAVTRLMCAFRDWWGYREPSDASMAASVERLLRSGEAEFLLAGPSEHPAGVCQLRYRYGVWLAAEDCWLEDLFVEERARGTGLGRALLEAALERARDRGCRRIQLDVNEANPALRLYERAGFSNWSDPPGGRNLFMGRRLDAAPG